MRRLPSGLLLPSLLVVFLALLGYQQESGLIVPGAPYPEILAVFTAYAALCLRCFRRRTGNVRPAEADQEGALLVCYASQTGFAEQLATEAAQACRAAGKAVTLRPLGSLDTAALARTARALFIVSTTGEGDAPDSASGFVGRTLGQAAPLAALRYGLLALGDSSYRDYCAFGRRLDRWLRAQQAQPLFDPIEVDNADPATLRRWEGELSALIGGAPSPRLDTTLPCRLAARQPLNAGSAGAPAFHVILEPLQALPEWRAGDIAELHLPDTGHRDYSIASLPTDGRIELLVRQRRHAEGHLGRASGWLTASGELGAAITVRIRRNSQFHPPEEDRPLILIGSGTGLAGLRAHLKARAAAGRRRNWLLFGERSRTHDFFFRSEIEAWQEAGFLERLDLAFSRDQAERVYVQQRLRQAGDLLRRWVEEGAAIYVCGDRRGMAPGVHTALEEILGADRLGTLTEAGRYRRDVY